MERKGAPKRKAKASEDAPKAAETHLELSESGEDPDDTDTRLSIEIEKAAQRKNRVAAGKLHAFLQRVGAQRVTGQGDAATNVIDQGDRVPYAFAPDEVQQLLRCLDECRREGSIAHFSERQWFTGVFKTGIMLDYDPVITDPKRTFQTEHFTRYAKALARRLQHDLDFSAHKVNGKFAFHVFFIVKPRAAPIKDRPGMHKYGLHALVPGVRVSRGYKKWLVREFRAEPAVAAVLREIGAVGDPAACLDAGSASVPVLFFGSCKRGGTVAYALGAAVAVTLYLDTDEPPDVRVLTDDELAPFCLTAELALHADAAYDTGEPLVRKLDFEPVAPIRAKVEDLAQRSAGDAIAEDELARADHDIATLTLYNAEARLLHSLLDILPPEHYTDRNRRRDVIFALANTSESLRPLAAWFCQKFPLRWNLPLSDNGRDAFERLWADALRARAARAGAECLSKGSIIHWAQASPRFAEVMHRSYYNTLRKFAFDSGGRLQHAMVARVLHVMVGAKFCTDFAPGKTAFDWFEFVVAGERMERGEVWKWRLEPRPVALQLYISDHLAKVFEQLAEFIDAKAQAARDEREAKYYAALARNFAASRNNLHNDAFKAGVVSQCQHVFHRRGFAKALDRAPDLLGVGNGVLRLGAACRLIDHFHEFPVSRFTPVPWRRFDPDRSAWDRTVLRMVVDVLPEEDARLFFMMYFASSLYGGAKESLMLIWEGGGQNGKTALVKAAANALGAYGKKLAIGLFTAEREDPNSPNSALMALKDTRLGYVEELNKAERANPARIKELVSSGKVSARETFGRQEEVEMTANILVASQYSFIITVSDHGTWRRIKHYTSKVKFVARPDPRNPLEKQENQAFAREYPGNPDFLEAFLAMLVHFYERLQREFGGQVKNVPAPTIEFESEAYRNSQDSLNRFISERVVVAPDHGVEYPLSIVAQHYIEWYGENIERNHKHVAGDVIKDLASSALQKHLRYAVNNTQVLTGCRIMLPAALVVLAGEALIGRAAARRDVDVAALARADNDTWWRAAEVKADAEVFGAGPPARSLRADNVAVDEGEALDAPNDDWELIVAENKATAPAPAPIDLDAVFASLEAREYTVDDIYS
ncbi:MAG: hypothetical protein KGL39_18825 [Patescibacteria group bacterium]|nr:hypothetical protein [Patescibacteria group bacterium]